MNIHLQKVERWSQGDPTLGRLESIGTDLTADWPLQFSQLQIEAPHSDLETSVFTGQAQSRMETLGLAKKQTSWKSVPCPAPYSLFLSLRPVSLCSDRSRTEAASSVYYSTRRELLSELQRKCGNELEFDVEASKSHWTELSAATAEFDDSDVQVPNSAASADSDDSDEQVPNNVLFKMMKEHELWGPIFWREPCELEIVAKIAEGGQAEIFEAVGRKFGERLVVKVFKKRYSLVDLQKSWPPALALYAFLETLGFSAEMSSYLCWVVGVHLMDNGRFAFVFKRQLGDLRKLIDKQMLKSNGRPPFDGYVTHKHISSIA